VNDFVEVKANDRSIWMRQIVLGVGLNDAEYQVNPIINGKQVTCPIYHKWRGMLKRCYCAKTQARQPTYAGATVAKEWLTFSVFKSWMIKQDWKDKELDKDIISPGNKHYSSETCCLVPRALNNMLTDSGAARGDYPKGVCFDKPTGKYIAQCYYKGKQKKLGRYLTPEEASLAYRKFKASLVAEAAFEQTDERIEHGLMLHAALILKGE